MLFLSLSTCLLLVGYSYILPQKKENRKKKNHIRDDENTIISNDFPIFLNRIIFYIERPEKDGPTKKSSNFTND
jgi:hypothetical protein